MYQIIAFLLIISTLAIVVIKPDLHRQLIVYDSRYVVLDSEDTESKEQIKEIPEVNIEEKTTKKVQEEIIEEKVEKKAPTAVVQTTVQKQEPIKTTTAPKKTVNTTSSQKVTQKTTPKTTTETKTVEQKKVTVQTLPKTTVPKVQEIKTVKEEIKTTPTTREAEEERISWNKWHSRIQNKIMDDVKMPAVPYGTVFEFKFDVDKYGRVTNVKTSSKNPQYSYLAVQNIAPLIRSYQGKEILNFPANSQRTSTTFEGRFTISPRSKYSRPEDYNDTERVIR